jgi:hypothetical protein
MWLKGTRLFSLVVLNLEEALRRAVGGRAGDVDLTLAAVAESSSDAKRSAKSRSHVDWRTSFAACIWGDSVSQPPLTSVADISTPYVLLHFLCSLLMMENLRPV